MMPCLNQSTVMQAPAEAFVEVARDEGFHHVELRYEAAEAYFTQHGADAWSALLERTSVQVAAMNSLEYFSLVPESSYEFMERKTHLLCSLCRLAQTDLLVTVPSLHVPHMPVVKVLEDTVNRLRRLAAIAEEYGVRLGFEPIGFPWYSIRRWDMAIDIVNKVQRDNVGLVVDAWNFFLGGNKLEDLRSTPADKLWLVHINDGPGKKPNMTDHDRLLPGEGTFPLEDFIGELRRLGYAGPVSIELFHRELWQMPARDAVRRSFHSLRPLLH